MSVSQKHNMYELNYNGLTSYVSNYFYCRIRADELFYDAVKWDVGPTSVKNVNTILSDIETSILRMIARIPLTVFIARQHSNADDLRHVQWPFTNPNPFFKVMPIFDAEYLGNGTRQTHI